MCILGWQYFATHPSNEQRDTGWHHQGRTWKCHHNFFQTLKIKHMTSFFKNLKWKYLWKCIHGRSFGATEQQLNLDNLKNKFETLLKFEVRQQHWSQGKQVEERQKCGNGVGKE
jgi:hypothetical protein